MQPPGPIAPPQRILIRGVNWLGDAVMTTPALRRLRERYPETHLALLAHQKLADLWRGHPCLDAVLTFAPGDSPWTVGRRLRAERFTTALVLPNSPRAALEVWLARIPRRIGYARPWRNWFLTETIRSRPGHRKMRRRSLREIRRLAAGAGAGAHPPTSPGDSPHQIHEYLHLAAALGASSEPLPPRLHLGPEERSAGARRFGLPDSTLLLGLNPGAEYGPAKRWPMDRFIAAAREIQCRTGCCWVILGGPGDQPAAATIAAALGDTRDAVRNLAGQTSLRELMAVLKLCRVLLTNDTGPMHLAAALGTPVVVPFGSTSPELTGPGLPGDPLHHLLRANAPCSPCFRRVCPVDFRCMRQITATQVAGAVLEALSQVRAQ